MHKKDEFTISRENLAAQVWPSARRWEHVEDLLKFLGPDAGYRFFTKQVAPHLAKKDDANVRRSFWATTILYRDTDDPKRRTKLKTIMDRLIDETTEAAGSALLVDMGKRVARMNRRHKKRLAAEARVARLKATNEKARRVTGPEVKAVGKTPAQGVDPNG